MDKLKSAIDNLQLSAMTIHKDNYGLERLVKARKALVVIVRECLNEVGATPEYLSKFNKKLSMD